MGFLSKFEGKMEDTFEGAADKMFDAPISPVQIAKKAEKQMRREKMVGAGKQYAPTLYTVLVNADDDRRLFGYYPTLAGETETYLAAKAGEQGLVMDGQPLVRFIVDEGLKHGKFDVIAEAVAAPIIAQLRAEEMQRYGLVAPNGAAPAQSYAASQPQAQPYAPQQYQPQPAAPAPAPQAAPAAAPYASAAGDHSFADDAAAPNAGDPFSIAGAAIAAGGAAAAGAAAANAAAPQAAPAAPVAAPDTVVFAPAAQAAPAVPNAHAVHACLTDLGTHRPINLAGTRFTLGRESKNDVVVPDINVSRVHAELRLDPQGTWIVTDLGSTNGTYVNGRAVKAQPLASGDQLTVGTTTFAFTLA